MVPKSVKYNYEIRSPDFIQGVAQLGSARALGARGREFESHHPDHFLEMRDMVLRDMVGRDMVRRDMVMRGR